MYGTEADFEAYCEARGYTIPAGDVEPALLRASMFIDGSFGGQFQGLKTGGRAQERAWPRTGACDAEGNLISSDEVPLEIEQATYEAALRELASPGSLTPDVTPGTIKKSVRVEGAVSVDYAVGSGVQDQRPVLTVLGGILAPLLGNSGSSIFAQAVRG